MAKKDDTPLDVVQLAARVPEVPLAAELGDFLGRTRRMFEQFYHRALDLEARMAASVLADLRDDELALHQLWLLEVEALFDELGKRAGQVRQQNELRMSIVLAARGSTGFAAFGKSFEVTGDLLPSAPARSHEDWPAFIEFMRARYPGALLDSVPTVPFGALKTTVEDLTAKGEPPPPGVKLSSTFKVKVRG